MAVIVHWFPRVVAGKAGYPTEEVRTGVLRRRLWGVSTDLPLHGADLCNWWVMEVLAALNTDILKYVWPYIL